MLTNKEVTVDVIDVVKNNIILIENLIKQNPFNNVNTVVDLIVVNFIFKLMQNLVYYIVLLIKIKQVIIINDFNKANLVNYLYDQN